MKNNSRPFLYDHSRMQIKYKSILQVLLLIIFTNILVACKHNTNPQDTQTQVKADSTAAIASNDTLQTQYNAARMQLDQLATAKAALDSEVVKKDAEIAKLKGQVGHLEKNNKALAAKLKKANKFIASLKDELSDKAKALAEQLGILQNDKNSLAQQLDALTTKYNNLKTLGSVLHASDIRLMAVHLKHHGKREKNTDRARKADVLKVCFDIDENRIAENGTKKLYLVITAPDGKLLSNPTSGSGVTTASDGNPLNYSVLKEVPLKQDEPVKNVTVDWRQDNDYEKGDYKIAIYNGGYKIGDGDVVLN
jgi:peptidoglycan hydrolase CwlO-like protein